MRGHLFRLLSLTAMLGLLGATVAAGAAGRWSRVTRITVEAATGGWPPGANSHTLRFTTSAQLQKATSALIAYRIKPRSGPGDPSTCGNSTGVTITVASRTKKTKYLPARTKQTRMTAYFCGTKTYGNIDGNVRGFIQAVGLKKL